MVIFLTYANKYLNNACGTPNTIGAATPAALFPTCHKKAAKPRAGEFVRLFITLSLSVVTTCVLLSFKFKPYTDTVK